MPDKPVDGLAIQVSYSMTESDGTFEREVNTLKKLPDALLCKCPMILANDESSTIDDRYGTIELMSVWKWLLQQRLVYFF